MATTQVPLTKSAVADARRVLDMVLDGYAPRDFAVRFWDGSVWEAETPEPAYTLVLHHPGCVRLMFDPRNKIGLGEAYIYDDFDIDGDILAFTRLLKHLVGRHQAWGTGQKLRFLWRLLRLPSDRKERRGRQPVELTGTKRSPERDRQAITYHYDIPADMFALFLDRDKQYTCGYFRTPEDELDACQLRKMDHVCRKLRLKPGERLVDFGCGWGNLIVHAARHYGVEAVGVTLSAEQARSAEELIRSHGLQDRCRIALCDYREFSEERPFDKACSVGFVEHLGEKGMPIFFGKLWRLLRPNGLYLHHCITLKAHAPYPRWTAFARKYVFPDGEVRPVSTSFRAGERAGFEIRDVENLREHYALTLERWVRKLESNHDEVVRLTDEVNYRVFRIYMAGGTIGFRNGTYNLFQTLFSKPDGGVSELPLTREDLYRQGHD